MSNPKDDLVITVDLRALIDHGYPAYWYPLERWAYNALDTHPRGVVSLLPETVQHLALCAGVGHERLAAYLGQFPPKP